MSVEPCNIALMNVLMNTLTIELPLFCEECGGILHPDVVRVGERLPETDVMQLTNL